MFQFSPVVVENQAKGTGPDLSDLQCSNIYLKMPVLTIIVYLDKIGDTNHFFLFGLYDLSLWMVYIILIAQKYTCLNQLSVQDLYSPSETIWWILLSQIAMFLENFPAPMTNTLQLEATQIGYVKMASVFQYLILQTHDKKQW